MAERLYYGDSFLNEFTGRVTDIRELSRTAGLSLWQIALDRTAFYPTSGGQPYDVGTLKATSRSGAVLEIPIESVEEDSEGEVWHYTNKPLMAGTEVRGEVDWQRRFDHMQQHTGQHLLSAVFARELHAPTVSFHLGDESSTIDLERESFPSASLERVESHVNQIIAEDRAVAPRVVDRAEAERLLAEGALRKLPERDGMIRLVEIEDLDLNACGGTHVRSTGQIGGLLLRSTEKMRKGLRVEFVCGQRAVASARRDFELLTRTGALLSVGKPEIPASIERLQAEAKVAAKERQKIREDLAEYHAASLIAEHSIEDRLRVVRKVFADRDAEYIRILASRICASAPRTLALLASTPREPAAIVMACSGDVSVSCGALMREALADLGLRGGGSSGLAQAQAPLGALDALFSRLAAEVRKAGLSG
jgi:alanyl-tRNA synthetase